MERETLSNNTEYQERLREGRIKGVSLLQYVRQLQQQITEVSVDTVNIVDCRVSKLFPSLATGE